ncbi:MAG: hypothetical protein IPL52_07580 [Flavobacteriales bacterium]|nr:hypothetical protein [Flavobacteriales bacterium]
MAAQAKDYFTRKALQGFGMASLAVTLIANFINVVYEKVSGTGPSDGVMAIVGISLSVAVVAFFSEREEGLSKGQRAFIMMLNAIVLFNANAGVNAFLYDKLGREEGGASTSVILHQGPARANFLDALKGIIVPRTPWFSQDLPELNGYRNELERTKEEVATLVVLDTIHARIDTLAEAQARNLRTIAARDSELVAVRKEYQRTLVTSLEHAATYEQRLAELQRAVRENPALAMEGIADLRNEVAARSDSGTAVQQQMRVRFEEQNALQVQQQQQAMEQEQQQQQLQQQVLLQQQQLNKVRQRLFR